MSRVEFGAVDLEDKKLRDILSTRGAKAAFTLLSSKKKMLDVGSEKFTHKTTCPNPAHKGGHETTPSFFVNQETGQYYCYGCSCYGNSFDLIALLGGNDTAAVNSAYSAGPVEIPSGPNPNDVANKVSRQIIKDARNWLESRQGLPSWKQDFDWIQAFYAKLDIAIKASLTDNSPESVYGRFLILKMEIKRKIT